MHNRFLPFLLLLLVWSPTLGQFSEGPVRAKKNTVKVFGFPTAGVHLKVAYERRITPRSSFQVNGGIWWTLFEGLDRFHWLTGEYRFYYIACKPGSPRICRVLQPYLGGLGGLLFDSHHHDGPADRSKAMRTGIAGFFGIQLWFGKRIGLDLNAGGGALTTIYSGHKQDLGRIAPFPKAAFDLCYRF